MRVFTSQQVGRFPRPIGFILAVMLFISGNATVYAQTDTDYTVTVGGKVINTRPEAPASYYVDGVEIPVLTLERGVTYTFTMQGVPAMHPFYLTTSASGGGGSAYEEGVENNFATGDEVLTFTPGETTPDTLYYQCAAHEYMGSALHIVDAADTDSADFMAELSGRQEVPAKATPAMGSVSASLSGDTLVVSGSFSGLSSDFNAAVRGGAHIHRAPFGRNGGIVIELNTTVNPDNRSGSFDPDSNTFVLTAEVLTTLERGELYVNIHTAANPGGEIRGQLLHGDAVLYEAFFAGPNSTGAGGAILQVRGDTLQFSGAFQNLVSDFNPAIAGGAHIHQAPLGESGPVVIPLNTDPDDDLRGGVFPDSVNTYILTADQKTALENRVLYVNVHTVEYPGGEIRGQIFPFGTKILEARLSGEHELNPVPTTGSGFVTAAIDPDNTLILAGSFAELISPFNPAVRGGAHIHQAPANANGGIVFELQTTISGDSLGGSFAADSNRFELTDEQVEAFWMGNFYVNVHTADYPGGEIRGQLVPVPNVAPSAPVLTMPAGGSTVEITGEPDSTIMVMWDASTDPNNTPIRYRWELSESEDFSTVAFAATADANGEVMATNRLLADVLDTLGVELDGSAELYQRITASDGSRTTASEVTEVTLTRGTITANEPDPSLPTEFALRGNYPNPFNPVTTIRFDLPVSADVTVEVFDLLGRRTLVLPAVALAPGSGREIRVDASMLATGMYLYRVLARTATELKVQTGEMILVK